MTVLESMAGGRRSDRAEPRACVEDYVNKQIATVNDRITALEGRVGQVDQAARRPMPRRKLQGSAQQANQRIDALTSRVDGIEQRLSSKKPRN